MVTQDVDRDTGPVHIQLSRKKGWRMPPNTVKVTRPGPWGNPFRAEGGYTAAAAVADFETQLLSDPQKVEAAITQLRGRNLACWCAHDQPCHADVLLRVANPARS